MFKLIWFCTVVAVTISLSSTDEYHPVNKLDDSLFDPNNPENDAKFWVDKAESTLNDILNRKVNKNKAKNIILFLGDGMSVPTLAATRLLLGNENAELSFEKFPHTAVSKTYCVDKQVADSACTSTAYLTGVKANYNTLGVTGAVALNDCEKMIDPANQVDSIAKWAQDAGKSTGIVTTSTVVDASPTGAYAHTANRVWQSDTDVTKAGKDPEKCIDIATQLVRGQVGSKFNVIMGGGAEKFLVQPDGDRTKTDLIEVWKTSKKDLNAQYVTSREELQNLTNETDFVLGLFSKQYMPYNLKRSQILTPSLEEMTEAALKIAAKNENGYFLFIEGGLIDHGHHETRAKLALDETLEFSKAVQKAVDLTSEEDTLIVVTADHAHTMSLSGYAARGSDIYGAAPSKADDGLPYLILNYANGQGYKLSENDGSGTLKRPDPTIGINNNIDYQFPAVAPLSAETHGGDDVLIFARGPWSHLFSGVLEENMIPHIMGYAAGITNFQKKETK